MRCVHARVCCCSHQRTQYTMDMKLIILLTVFQGFHLGFVCRGQRVLYLVRALLGSCVELPCTHMFDDTSDMSGVVWYAGDQEILNTKNSSSALEEYRNQTSLVPGKDCTLRIDPVRREDDNTYYSRSADDTTPQDYYRRYPKEVIHLYVTDFPGGLMFSVPKNLTEENATTIPCSVDHTCGSSPPTIQWNKPGRVTTLRSKDSTYSQWREESELTYIPTYVDDGSHIRCSVTFYNGKNIWTSTELRILFAPKHVTATVIENGEILEGSDVNLMCMSISKPEVIMYEWYKGENRTLLPYKRWKMTVHNVTRDMEPYSCAAINTVGRGESALMKIPVLYEGSSYSFTESNNNVIILATIGTVVPLLLLLVVFLYWRKRCRKVTSREAVESPDATYSNLVKKDIAAEHYMELRPVNSKHIAMRGQVGAGNQQENKRKKNGRTVQSFT